MFEKALSILSLQFCRSSSFLRFHALKNVNGLGCGWPVLRRNGVGSCSFCRGSPVFLKVVRELKTNSVIARITQTGTAFIRRTGTNYGWNDFHFVGNEVAKGGR